MYGAGAADVNCVVVVAELIAESVISGGINVDLCGTSGAFSVEDCDGCVVDKDDVVAAISPVGNGTADNFESDAVVLRSCCEVFSDEPCTETLCL